MEGEGSWRERGGQVKRGKFKLIVILFNYIHRLNTLSFKNTVKKLECSFDLAGTQISTEQSNRCVGILCTYIHAYISVTTSTYIYSTLSLSGGKLSS